MFRFWLFLSCAVVLLAPAQAANPLYDTLARITTPLVNVLSEQPTGPERALSLAGHLEEAAGLPPELKGLAVELAVEYPDKLRLHGPVLGQTITLARRGEQIWVHPGTALKALLESPEVEKRLPKPDKKFKLRPFKLPLSAKELFFLPVLFQVTAVPAEEALGMTAMDLQLMPELEKSLKLKDAQARVWVGENGQPARLALTQPKGRVVVSFDRFAYTRSLPPETWIPTPEQQADVMLVPPARYDQLVRALLEFRR